MFDFNNGSFRRKRLAVLASIAIFVCFAGSAAVSFFIWPKGVEREAKGQSSGTPASTQHGSNGLGYHDPRSAVPRLVKRSDVIDWEVLATVKAGVKDNRIVAEFSEAVKALDGKVIRVQGFMLPLEASQKQDHFLLSSAPTSCPFCVPAGPEGLVDVRPSKAIRHSINPIVLEGRFSVLFDAKEGLFYRVVDAGLVD